MDPQAQAVTLPCLKVYLWSLLLCWGVLSSPSPAPSWQLLWSPPPLCTSLMGWTWKKTHCATKAVQPVGTGGSLIVFPQSHSQGCAFKIFTPSKPLWLLQRDTRRSRTGHVASGEALCWCLCLDYLYISFFYQPHRGIPCAASTCPSQPLPFLLFSHLFFILSFPTANMSHDLLWAFAGASTLKSNINQDS